jgi:hypothetical protein
MGLIGPKSWDGRRYVGAGPEARTLARGRVRHSVGDHRGSRSHAPLRTRARPAGHDDLDHRVGRLRSAPAEPSRRPRATAPPFLSPWFVGPRRSLRRSPCPRRSRHGSPVPAESREPDGLGTAASAGPMPWSRAGGQEALLARPAHSPPMEVEPDVAPLADGRNGTDEARRPTPHERRPRATATATATGRNENTTPTGRPRCVTSSRSGWRRSAS